MDEYIRRKDVLEALTYNGIGDDPNDLISLVLATTRKAVRRVTAADVVEVVRCEKCKFAAMCIDIIGDPHLFCTECNFREVDFDGYCSHGERKEK